MPRSESSVRRDLSEAVDDVFRAYRTLSDELDRWELPEEVQERFADLRDALADLEDVVDGA